MGFLSLCNFFIIQAHFTFFFLEMNKHSGPNKGMLVRFFPQKNKLGAEFIWNTRGSY